jgi:ribosomal protein S18 acetylase RimI-like enzyme
MKDSIKIQFCGEERIADLEPLWKALQQHHIEISANLGKTRTLEESWQMRLADYRIWIKEEASFILIAEDNGRPVGYAFVMAKKASTSFATPDDYMDLQTLSILPEYRGQGVGDALMREMFRILRERGVTQMSLGVVATNDRAIKFYERYGLITKYLTLWGHIPEN